MDTVKAARPVVLLLTMATAMCLPAGASALTQILRESTVEADQQSVSELIGMFDRSEEAIRSRDLNATMGLYAVNYRYHGLKPDDVRKIWTDLFAQFDLISNIHTFSAIKILKSGKDTAAEITCTGAVWANSRDTKQRIPIDSGYQGAHRLVKGKDGWRTTVRARRSVLRCAG